MDNVSLLPLTIQKWSLKCLDTHLEADSATKRYWKIYLTCIWLFILVRVPSTTMEEAGLMTYAAANHQVAIKARWLQCYLNMFELHPDHK